MIQDQIKTLIEARAPTDGLLPSGIDGVQLFRATAPMPCVPAVYEPCVVAIVSGNKEVVLDGRRFVYDTGQYLCCPMSMPVNAGTPAASPENPLYGVYISLEQPVMTELIVEMEATDHAQNGAVAAQAIHLARWDAQFSEALLRLLQLGENETDLRVLGAARLREVLYAILCGEAGQFARHAFGVGNGIARSIAHLSAHLDAPISIDDMAARAGLSRAVFHRKFKQATTMSPIQYAKKMRLNSAATRLAQGQTVSAAAMDVGYVSASQFSREFKRIYGQSPRQWSDEQRVS